MTEYRDRLGGSNKRKAKKATWATDHAQGEVVIEVVSIGRMDALVCVSTVDLHFVFRLVEHLAGGSQTGNHLLCPKMQSHNVQHTKLHCMTHKMHTESLKHTHTHTHNTNNHIIRITYQISTHDLGFHSVSTTWVWCHFIHRTRCSVPTPHTEVPELTFEKVINSCIKIIASPGVLLLWFLT